VEGSFDAFGVESVEKCRIVSDSVNLCKINYILSQYPGPAPEWTEEKTRLQHSHSIWQTSDGLPNNSVQALAQIPAAPIRAMVEDRRGRLWIGTSAGLAILEEDGAVQTSTS
jgi:hypothetical protein